MIELTREQHQRLKPLEQHLIRAVRGNYVFNMLLTEAKELFEIYNEVYGKNEKTYGCTRCRLNVAKAVGTLYFQYLENTKKRTTKISGDKKPNKTKKRTVK